MEKHGNRKIQQEKKQEKIGGKSICGSFIVRV